MNRFLPYLFLLMPSFLYGQEGNLLNVMDTLMRPENFSTSLSVLLSMGAIGFVPIFLLSSTSFLRLVIVLSMIRQAIGTQQAPPNMIIVALALFLTVFVMTPTFDEVRQTAIAPYQQGNVSQLEMLDLSIKPFKYFMLKFTREKDLALFLEVSQIQYTQDYNNVPIFVLIPAFIISELKTAFQIGFLLFIPFIVIDLIVSNILLSLGMFMLSPAMISLPFKILLFVLTDGWNLIVQGILVSYR